MSEAESKFGRWFFRVFWSVFGSALAGIIGTFAWERAQQAVPQRSFELSGTLFPGREEGIRTACDRNPNIKPADVTLLLGGNAFILRKGDPPVTVLRVFERDVLSLAISKDGFLDVYANIYDGEGRLAVTLSGPNKYELKDPRFGPIRKSKDQDILIVEDGNKGEIFNVRFRNPTTVQIQGRFVTPGQPPVLVTQDKLSFGSALTAATRNCWGTPGFAFGRGIPSEAELAYARSKHLSYFTIRQDE